jgi:hypothetical protein
MMGKKYWLLAILVIFSFTLCATLQSDAGGPPPVNDIKIIPPGADVPKEIAAFSGKWVGEIKNASEVFLVVEEINDSWASIVYSWGDVIRLGTSAGYSRQKCKVIPGSKPKIVRESVQNKSRPDMIFELTDSDTIEARQGSLSGTLKKAP